MNSMDFDTADQLMMTAEMASKVALHVGWSGPQRPVQPKEDYPFS